MMAAHQAVRSVSLSVRCGDWKVARVSDEYTPGNFSGHATPRSAAIAAAPRCRARGWRPRSRFQIIASGKDEGEIALDRLVARQLARGMPAQRVLQQRSKAEFGQVKSAGAACGARPPPARAGRKCARILPVDLKRGGAAGLPGLREVARSHGRRRRVEQAEDGFQHTLQLVKRRVRGKHYRRRGRHRAGQAERERRQLFYLLLRAGKAGTHLKQPRRQDVARQVLRQHGHHAGQQRRPQVGVVFAEWIFKRNRRSCGAHRRPTPPRSRTCSKAPPCSQARAAGRGSPASGRALRMGDHRARRGQRVAKRL